MKSEIRNIKLIYKFGAFGDPNKFGTWVYGKRPDGKTVACKQKPTEAGGMMIWSHWKSPSCKEDEIDRCATEFSKEEWAEIRRAEKEDQSRICNQILRTRTERN